MNNLLKPTTPILIILSLVAATAVTAYFFKANEVSDKNARISEIEAKLQVSLDEQRRLRVLSSLLKNSSGGITATNPETIKKVSEVVSYIVQLKDPAELEFGECWDRKMNTQSWGSDGPYGLLESCIDKIKSAKTAILMHEIDAAANVAIEECGSNAKNRYEKSEMCNADSNYHLLVGARNTLFTAITSPESIYDKNISLD